MKVALKIRGIYTTALTKFFTEKGLTIVSPSEEILKRFGSSRAIDSLRSMDLAIGDLEGGQGILLEGRPEALNQVIRLIRETFVDAICRRIDSGEQHAMAEVEFPYLAKSSLDGLRGSVVPTLFNHHRLRIIASEYVDLIETKELAYHPEKRERVSLNLEKRLIWDTYKAGKEMGIDHVKLDGRVISLSEGEIVEINHKEKGLILKRTKFKGRHKYDGLNIYKKEGDYAITTVKEGDWYYEHAYFRQNGQLIGTYYNINTLIEFYPDRIRYVDLEIDVVRWPDGKTQTIDEEGLNRYLKAGYLGEALKKRAEKTAHELQAMERMGLNWR